MDGLGIADTVVIRHICHCDGAIEHPGHDEVTEHVFTVDGEDFPWYVSQRGPIVTQLGDDWYTVDVEIFLLDKGTKESLEFSYWPRSLSQGGSSVPYIPVIGGRNFPWTCTDDEITLRFNHKMIPTLHLKFFARSVDAKGIEIEDRRPQWADRAMYRAGGDLVKDGADECCWCGDLVDNMWEHIEREHPERVTGRTAQVSG